MHSSFHFCCPSLILALFFPTDCPNLSSVLEVVGDGVLIIDTKSDEVKYLNRALELLFEIERFTVLGKPLPSTIFNNSDDLKSFHSLAKKSIELFQLSNNALPSQRIGNSFIEREFSFPVRTKKGSLFNINVLFYPFNSLSTQSSNQYNSREFPTQVCCIFQRKKEKRAKKTKPKTTTNGCIDLNHSTSSSTDEDRDIPEYMNPTSYSNHSASTSEKSENYNSDNNNNDNNNNNSKNLWTLDGSGLRLVVTERTPVSAGFTGTRFPYDSLKYFRVNHTFSDIILDILKPNII